MAIKHLVTSGCSFSDNVVHEGGRWPHHLATLLNINLYNRGQGSAGNDWISDSAIYQTQKLLNSGIPSEEIAVVVCWSGIDRGSIHVSRNERVDFDSLINDVGGNKNPVSFIENEPNQDHFTTTKGWLLGSPLCNWQNSNITELKKVHFENFYSQEERMISSLKHWLSLQWFCEKYKIKLLNFTYMSIFNYPYHAEYSSTLFYQNYPDTKYLFDMLDLSKWWFHKDYLGLREWVSDKKLQFYPNSFHPRPESHKIFVEEVLCEKF